MVWVIVEFIDQTVSCIPKKYLSPKIKKCYFPKTNAASKIKRAVDVDTKSGEWSLIPYRLLMHGEEFETYDLARKAEKIGQNYSTMSSFEKSFTAKQVARKRPIVHFDTSSESSEGETQDFKNVKKLAKLDAGLMVDENKDYHYNSGVGKNNYNGSAGQFCQSLATNINESTASDGNRSVANDDNQSVTSDDDQSVTSDDNQSVTSDDDQSVTSDDDQSVTSNDNRSVASDDNQFYNEDADQNSNNDEPANNDEPVNNDFSNDSSEDEVDEDSSSVSDDGMKRDDSKLFNQVQRDYTDHLELESTNREQSLLNTGSPQYFGYKDFSDARRLPFIEKGVFCACQQLEENKAILKEIKEISNDTKVLIGSLMPIIKDLTVEVFDSKEELKKRNGMFTDLLSPDIQLSIKRVQQYDDVTVALKKHKNVDNMIKYLGSTINEPKEKGFIKACLGVVFQTKFFVKKVWWKNETGKVNLKNSLILHCIRESFKTKFGLAEPKKSDENINKLIYKISRNMKDTWRKAKKTENEKKAKNARKALEDAMKVKKKTKKHANSVVEELQSKKSIGKKTDAFEGTKKIKNVSGNKAKEQTEVDRNQNNKKLETEQYKETQRNLDKKAIKAAKKAAKLEQEAKHNEINATVDEPFEADLGECVESSGTKKGNGVKHAKMNAKIKKAVELEQCEDVTEKDKTNGKKYRAGQDYEDDRKGKKAKKTEKVEHGNESPVGEYAESGATDERTGDKKRWAPLNHEDERNIKKAKKTEKIKNGNEAPVGEYAESGATDEGTGDKKRWAPLNHEDEQNIKKTKKTEKIKHRNKAPVGEYAESGETDEGTGGKKRWAPLNHEDEQNVKKGKKVRHGKEANVGEYAESSETHDGGGKKCQTQEDCEDEQNLKKCKKSEKVKLGKKSK